MTALPLLDALAGLIPPESAKVDELVEPFARLCDRAAEVGVRAHLEFIPTTAVPAVRTASEIVTTRHQSLRIAASQSA